ncbi:MAG: type IV pilus twitching motility protein PilT [Candidatus Marinimicrobia bacterium]|nr:type IV pilus twitching motility protein PilT [Candidatus Neomarinimicrobiota bacterium]MCF7839530.1 type IV pilus twitching motility protein PilT [Candidatus Neomarinimicrobiota bacterium]MCF7902479.1 type IV pilus twitching motility protein PilT [Candidatus Neomarinimicrobiota bacterium]
MAREYGASDLHLSPYSPPIVRVDGRMLRAKLPELMPEDVHMLVYNLMGDEERKKYEEELELDFAYEYTGVGRYRVNVFKGLRGDTAVLRAVTDKLFSFSDLGLPEVTKDLISREKGLILVTGPTGSGKSTSLNTMIDYINQNFRRHIITVEDPVEFVHDSKRALVNQREVGPNTKSFTRALRSALREDPDVIVVGEMRDLETTSLAITAAETGHLVFGTLHTMSAAKTIDRIIDQFSADRQSQIRTMLSESILASVSQVLLPKRGGGRVAAYEIMIGTPAVRNLIRESKTYQIPSVQQTSGKLGMVTMGQSLLALISKGVVDRQDALHIAADSEEIKKQIEKASDS